MTAVLITGATGKQGGALIRSLILRKAPFEILAVTRNPTSASAQKLANLSPNIKLVEGDLGNPGVIFQNAQRLTASLIWGVYSVQAAIGNNAEESQGKALIDESIKQKVKFFVYSSVDRGGKDRSFTNPTNIPHFIKKHNIEHHLVDRTKDGSMDWVILRPTAFYENLTPDFLGKVFTTCFKIALTGKPLQLVATSDIGFFGADAFMHPEQYKGKAVSLAGDELTFDGMKSIFEQRTGLPLPTTFRPVCSFFMAMMKDMGYMFKWLRDEGYGADISSIRALNPEMKDFATWLEKESGFKK
ncbi:nucleoside-diphosphate-sugar epimerase family protein [Talaromyces stipitatus ATCC 10500]|uniref:Nucleoside-diphosphate-sugar epimerase family protein n=1 Tax=Talaromyces stipitatus (strain ATCC 10500 / CBS 375.48 / QM 6759 / NRRL 1006) TaxID=441959 RepID=B8MA12_TALSN|nr:nucleoside-diphosphate-sugar epimerase family protein [Talaromyces stipitatus ATCC 10500]EED18341.1 nucleoside-diphosphate-sugar epimerase family protein [Talaromyces stipitatus ATCC 10500]